MRIRRSPVHIRVLIFSVGLVTLTAWRMFWLSGSPKLPEEGLEGAEGIPPDPDSVWQTQVLSRHLLTTLPNCTPRAVEQFPKGFFTQQQRQQGAIAVHILICVYMFLALAIVCDYYFVPSLEILCDHLNLQSDVAGATFMAAGSSAPELATAVIGVFIAKDDVGLGTVVGSAIYNVMFVISICGLFAGTVVHLHWWPMVRDCMCYLLSVLALVLVIMDETVKWYEAVCLCCLYLFYILLMYFNLRLERWLVPACSGCCPAKSVGEEDVLYDRIKSNGAISEGELNHCPESMQMLPLTSDCESDDGSYTDTNTFVKRAPPSASPHREEDEPAGLCEVPSGRWKKLLWFVSLPLCAILFISVPDCRKQAWKKWFLLTFLMSLVWLSLLSFFMVWMITVIGYTANIPDSIMGLTFVAFGVSLPDVVASLIVVREGLGDMAVSNAIGSNVFDILVCLGVPWLLQTAVLRPGSEVQVYSAGLTYSSLTLLSTVGFLLIATHLNGWKLDKKYGAVLLVVYVIYTVLASMYELNIFGYFHPVECPSNY
ncbi:probable sodium/potassium/calcium exchanger CG1090 isoform X1 [Haliotis rubra]|uniref:probable sodium/potassium/calcium exchanger CG1090 isoform X1 n=1 Tax=Haliotis rubra TaxID=36100 RepID=UPI001EE52C34|nr:probable sodium/potassium/calcium exchanger CG1090 isoform X1 [Haliotis rubra]